MTRRDLMKAYHDAVGILMRLEAYSASLGHIQAEGQLYRIRLHVESERHDLRYLSERIIWR